MNGTISISCLGSLGRFGNQLFQYAFARGYAESIGARLETPAWIGQVLFQGINDPPCASALPCLGLDVVPTNGATNLDLSGYFHSTEAFKWYTAAVARKWFTFKPEWKKLFEKPKKVAIHIRRGDYCTAYSNSFCTIEREAYDCALQSYGYSLSDVTVVSDESGNCAGPVPWLSDFLTLMNADVLFRANSTFSWWAGTLGNASVYSPVVGNKVGPRKDIPFVKGNHPYLAACAGNDYVLSGTLCKITV